MIYATEAQKKLMLRKLFWCAGYLTPDEIEKLGTHEWDKLTISSIIDDLFKITIPCHSDEERADRETAIKSIRLTLSKV